MNRPIFSLLTALLFTTTLCACATESGSKPASTAADTQQPSQIPVVLAEAPSPAPETVQTPAAPIKPTPVVEAPVSKTSSAPTGAIPPAREILAFARAQLPRQSIRMNGGLKDRAENGFVKKELTVEMDLNWGADPANATYRIRDEKTGLFQALEIQWLAGGPTYDYSENGKDIADFDPNKEIAGTGVTWADLSFSFLWTRQAETLRADKKLGRDCWVVAVPRGTNRLLLWIEKETGRVFGAKEEMPDGKMIKEIKVVSVKEFDKLWMIKDLDIIRPSENGRTSLRIETVEAVAP